MDTAVDGSNGISSLWTAPAKVKSSVENMVRFTEAFCKAPFCLYFRRVPTANRWPFSHETLFAPACWQLTVDCLSDITRFPGFFEYDFLGQLPGSPLRRRKLQLPNSCTAHQYLPKGENQDMGLIRTYNKPRVLDAQFFTPRCFIVMKHTGRHRVP